MTGFGQASEQVDGIVYVVEVRTVNNRYFKASVRLPEELFSLEAQLETQLRKHTLRGSITLNVKWSIANDRAGHQVNDQALLQYLEHLETIHQRMAGNHSVNIDLTALLTLPGVLQPAQDKNLLAQKAGPVLLSLVEQACEKLTQMRQTEGNALAKDLATHRKVIATRLQAIADRAPLVAEQYHQRLKNRMDDLLAKAQLEVAQPELIREVAIYAERCDIAEEIARLSGHLQQFDEIINNADGEPSGRTLDFLSQEMLREANTIASKSNDVQISHAIVEVKGAIDRIKEQVQNVE